MAYDFVADWRSMYRDDWPSLLLCLHTGGQWPLYCAPMLRDPAPCTGTEFDRGFLAAYQNAVACNSSIHDGAVLLGRESSSLPYRVAAWSMRLFPPSMASLSQANRGSAFNSCLEMSYVAGVDCMYLVSEGHLTRFENGVISLAA